MSHFDIDEIVGYLKKHLPEKYVSKSFIFGSLAYGKESPNDCDLFVVTNLTPASGKWKSFLTEIHTTKQGFKDKFSLSLNVSINTDLEFLEGSVFKTRILAGRVIAIKE